MEELQPCAQFIQSVIICGAEGNCISFRPTAATTLVFFLNATLLATGQRGVDWLVDERK